MSNEESNLAPYEGPIPPVDQSTAANTAVVAAIERSRAEIESNMTIAKRFPRDELKVHTKALALCERGSFADLAVYGFPRGGTTITGPSVNLARQLKRVWGNMDSGFQVLSIDEDYVHLRAVAHDLETNARTVLEHRFKKAVQRKNKRSGITEWKKVEDERDLRELIGRQGSILERNCILRTMPAGLVDDAFRKCQETNRKAAAGELKQSRDEVVRSLLGAFAQYGVTKDMLEARIDHSIEKIDDAEVADLRAIFKSLRGGESHRSDWFDLDEPEEQKRTTATLDPDKVKVKQHDEDPDPERREKKPAQKAPTEKKAATKTVVRTAGPKQRQALVAQAQEAGLDGETLYNLLVHVGVEQAAELDPNFDVASLDPDKLTGMKESHYRKAKDLIESGEWKQFHPEGEDQPSADTGELPMDGGNEDGPYKGFAMPAALADELKGLITDEGLPPETVQAILDGNFDGKKIRELTEEQGRELLEGLRDGRYWSDDDGDET